ncbi:MAG: AI-2E family transporter [archaeon]
MEHKILRKYIPIAIFAIFGFLSFMLIKPFAIYLLFAITIVLILNPLYKRIVAIIKNKTFSALIMLFFSILIIIIPFLFVINSLINEAPKVISMIRTSNFFTVEFIQETSDFVDATTGIEFDLRSAIQSIIYYMLNSAKNFLFALPNAILGIFIMFFSMFYLFKEGEELASYVRKCLPYPNTNKEAIIEKIKGITRGILYGHIITALAQGIIACIGYYIFGLNAPFFLGVLTTFFAVIPFIGPAFVYIPASLSLIVNAISTEQLPMAVRGIGLLIYGIAVISTVDNIIKPKIISDHSKIHPLIIIFGVLGGFQLLGFIGLILGPIIFAVFIELLALYQEDLKG